MQSRRSVLAGLLALSAAPSAGWADVGNPTFVSAARTPDGSFKLYGLTQAGQIAFECPLPARGHAAAAHPLRAEAVAFARRPGTFALILDCRSGAVRAQLESPQGRHFYGHGAFSRDGALLFTTENDFDAGQGVVGVWDVARNYQRIGEFSSGGVGPHDIKLMPDGETLVVANGGIETHPDTGRTKLNLPTMRSSLSYLSLEGALRSNMILPEAHQRNSIRHLAVSASGTVAFAMQWQGDLARDLPLLGLHERATDAPRLLAPASVRTMAGYLGSVAISPSGKDVAVTSPRVGTAMVFSENGAVTRVEENDVCGIASLGAGFVMTAGTGVVMPPSGKRVGHAVSWDNHLIRIAG